MSDVIVSSVLLIICMQAEARKSRQVVTEVERDFALSGKFDQLVEEQRRIDEERDAEVIYFLLS